MPPQAADGHEAIHDNNVPAGESTLVHYAKLAKRAAAQGNHQRAAELRDHGLRLWLDGK